MPRRALGGLATALTVIGVVAGVLVGGFFGLRALWNTTQIQLSSDTCTVGSYTVSPSQATVAATMVSVTTNRQLPERAAVLVLAAAYQESKLVNLAPGDGDRDSVGVLQQRPSQGWGSAADLSDIRFATSAFLDALVKVPNWLGIPLAHAIQAVQVSADENSYNQHADQAQALADALTGTVPAGISCTLSAPTKVATPTVVIAQLQRDLNVNPPTATGPQVRVPGASWQTAAWFVANADRLGIDQVAYDSQSWSRTNGWQASDAVKSAVIATMHA